MPFSAKNMQPLSMNLIKIWILILKLLLLHTILVVGFEAGNETDRLALLDFKAKITKDPLGIMSSWNESIHFCQWHGVTCGTQPERVTELNLQSSKLEGSISPSIGNLSFLYALNLQNNSFGHQIPSEFGNLGQLQVLRLHNNSITGKIPANISSCLNLVRINLSHNKLGGNVPAEIGLFSKLQVLILDGNELTGLPLSLGNLSSLSSLGVSYNHLSGTIPESLGRLKNLWFIGLGYNRLSGTIPATIFNQSSVEELHASYNDLQGILPWNLGITLPNLQTLAIGYNRYRGAFPFSLANASNLVNIIIPRNEFTGKLPALGKMPRLHKLVMSLNHLGNGEADDSNFLSSLINATSLTELSLDVNNISGVLPKSIGNFSTSLWKLVLAENRIFGSIPTGLGNLIRLETVNMWGNQFTGNIPNDIGDLHELKVLNMFDNKFVGNIPSSFGNLSVLINLNLGKNNLQGSIPSSIGNCQKLVRLELAQNKLTGVLPKEVIGVSMLAVFNLSHNNLTGSLPTEVGNLINLEKLDVSENMLSGQIPSTLDKCVRMEALHMQGNFFLGTIPSVLDSLRGIQSIDLSRNNFSGEIPTYLAEFKFLQNLNLSFNGFEGSLPTQGVFKNASAISVIGNNKLCGGVPELNLPACNFKGSTKNKLSLAEKILISMVPAGLVGISVCFLLFYWFRKRRIKPSFISQESSLMKVSYQSLLEATDGFSSINLIGSGGFGSVYKGILDGTVIAVKVLDLVHPGASKSFKAECEALRNIRHRNLVKVLTACSGVDFVGNEFKALVYEFMVNGSLEDWLHPKEESRKLDFLHRLDIAIDVACAVDYLHNGCQTPIVHCDLKPSNVLLDGDMTAHVGDFGLARFILQAKNNLYRDQTSSISIRGSIGYAAPEYGMGSEASTYGDVYSYGILLLEMFTGKRPIDDMFKGNLNLHNFAKMAFPKTVGEIADPLLLEQDGEGETSKNNHNYNHFSSQMIQEGLVSIFRIGVMCSVESPRERLDMGDVVEELILIRNSLLGAGG
ncbi:LRR receptor-like serine/threonine-protein kinase precursor [Actinidia chinensis var. chinensis]|uniref:non-specific serine/threonine protein kinase n=1 Tax=Actinidia chinensis var. chinensis TaxID=1590841 RepID=A0A2R6PYH5_ACTCC|nr:LRR receptor-like serine/threonine-protein kinase precursor [Actinidia chinensis var. chinensis]